MSAKTLKLITGFRDQDLELVTEDVAGSQKNLFIQGVFMEANRRNHNKRIYPKAILEEAVNGYMPKVLKGRAVGELGHPEGPKINLDRVSHRITALEWRDDDVMGRALILDTPMGKVARGLLEGGVMLGVSSRGLGNLNKRTAILEDYWLSTVDIVQDPSAPSAFVDGIMESAEWVWDNGLLKEQTVEGWRNQIRKASAKNLAEAQVRVFEDFLRR